MKILSCILCIILLYGNLLWALSPDTSLDKEKFTSTLYNLIQVLSDLRPSLISPSRVIQLPDTHLRENLELIWDTKAKAFFIYSQDPRSSPGVVYVIQSQESPPIKDLPQPIGSEIIGGMRIAVYTRTKELDYKIAQALAGSTRIFGPEDKKAIVDFIRGVDLDLARRVLLGVLKEEPIESPQILQLDKSTVINLEGIPNVETIRIDEDTWRLKRGTLSLDIQIITKDNRNFIRIGSRIYERYTGVDTIYIIDLLRDPLMWLGNADLVNFFGAEWIVTLVGTTHLGPASLGPVTWVGDLPGNLTQPAISPKDIENAYHHLEDAGLDPLLKVHYSLLVYLGFSPSELSRHKIPARDLEIISILGDNRINEFLYALLGVHDIIIPHIVSIQFRRFYQVLRRLSYIYDIDFISAIPDNLTPTQQDMVAGRIKSIMARIKDSEIQDFQSIDELNYLTSRLDQPLVFDYDPVRKTLVLNLSYLTQERRHKPPTPELYLSPKRGPPGFIDRDKVIVEAISYLVRTHPADVVKVIYQSSRYWEESWITCSIFQGLASNYQIAPIFPQKQFKDLRLGVFRPGFGLGGASVETETWIRDMFQKDGFFDADNIEVMSGSFAPEVNFGKRADKNRTIEPLVDAYKYRPLAKAIFGEGELDPELVRELAVEADIEPGSSDIETLQRVYDHRVGEIKDMFIRWITEKRLNIILGGQIAYPVENPVVYPALAEAVREINSARPPGDKVLAFVRHNYLAQWKSPRQGLRIDIPQAGDGIVIFSESETNNQIFEQILEWRPAMLYEAVRFPWVNESQDKPFQDQIRSDSDLTNSVHAFRDRLEREGIIISDQDILIVQPSRVDLNKRPDSTLYLAKALQDIEDREAQKKGRGPRTVRIIFLGQVKRGMPSKGTRYSGVEAETYQMIIDLAGELGLSDRIHFTGYIPQGEVLAALTFADIMAQASDRETFGRTPIEAMASAVPVIFSRSYVYPEHEEYQVFRGLFGGLHMFSLSPGRMVDGEWQEGEASPPQEMVERIYQIINNPRLREEMARENFFLSRRSMFNLANLNNFFKLWFLAYFDPERTNIGFRDRIVPVRRAGEVLSPLREAFRKRNIPERILYILNASPNLKRMLVKVDGLRYLLQIIDAIEEVRDTVIDSDRILPRLLAMLHEVEMGDPSEYLDIFLKVLLENRPGDIPQGIKKLIAGRDLGVIKGELRGLDLNSRVGLEYELIEFLSALILANIARHPEIFELHEVLCERKANCLGFAQLFSRLASVFGLEVGFADRSAEEGSSYNHIINVVTLSNGRKVNVDLMHGEIGHEYTRIRYLVRYLGDVEASVYNNRGAILGREGRLEEAEVALGIAITLDPGNPMAYANLSNIYRKREELAKARGALKTAVRLDPLYYRAWFTLAETCVEMGEFDEGVLHLGYLIEHGYRHADVYILLGDIYSHLSRLEDALKTYLEAWGVDKNNADLAFLIGISYYRLERMDKAWEFLQITLSLDREHPRAGQLLRFIPEIQGEDRLRDALLGDGRVSAGELREVVEAAGLVSETAEPRGIPPSGQEKIAGDLASSRIEQAVPPQGIDLPPAGPLSPEPAEAERYADTSV